MLSSLIQFPRDNITNKHLTDLAFSVCTVTVSVMHSVHKLRWKKTLERFSITFTANGKRQAEISRLPKTREIYVVSAYILPVSHSYGASTTNREISLNEIIFLLLRQGAACRLPFGFGRKREAKSLYYLTVRLLNSLSYSQI